LFAVTDGVYRGEFLFFVEKVDKKIWGFLSLPDRYIRNIPKQDFFKGIELGIIEQVAILPPDISKICKAQYYKDKKVS
jgi:hypothetical protein